MNRAQHSARKEDVTRPRSIVAVSGHPDQEELLEELLLCAIGYDVIVVESVAHGYSRIKELTPDLVVLLLNSDDVRGWQLLSMLVGDADLAGIPVVTGSTARVAIGFDDAFAALMGDAFGLDQTALMN